MNVPFGFDISRKHFSWCHTIAIDCICSEQGKARNVEREVVADLPRVGLRGAKTAKPASAGALVSGDDCSERLIEAELSNKVVPGAVTDNHTPQVKGLAFEASGEFHSELPRKLNWLEAWRFKMKYSGS